MFVFYVQVPSQQQFTMQHDSYFRRYSRWAEPASRQRRETDKANPDHRMCALFLQSDPLLWDYMTKPVAKGGKGYVSFYLLIDNQKQQYGDRGGLPTLPMLPSPHPEAVIFSCQ